MTYDVSYITIYNRNVFIKDLQSWHFVH